MHLAVMENWNTFLCCEQLLICHKRNDVEICNDASGAIASPSCPEKESHCHMLFSFTSRVVEARSMARHECKAPAKGFHAQDLPLRCPKENWCNCMIGSIIVVKLYWSFCQIARINQTNLDCIGLHRVRSSKDEGTQHLKTLLLIASDLSYKYNNQTMESLEDQHRRDEHNHCFWIPQHDEGPQLLMRRQALLWEEDRKVVSLVLLRPRPCALSNMKCDYLLNLPFGIN